MSIYSSKLYSPKEWAVLFSLCVEVQNIELILVQDFEDKESPFFNESATAVYNWLKQYSIDHGLPEPSSEDVYAIIEEASMYLNKFAENYHDDMENR